MRCLIALCFGLIVGMSTAHALTPPWEDSELESAADLIVEGTIGAPIRCVSPPERFANGTIGRYAVPLKIAKIEKGKAKPGDNVVLQFMHYFYKPGYTGDQDALPMPGETAKYYLRRSTGGQVHIVHWSGVKIITPGSGTLPKC